MKSIAAILTAAAVTFLASASAFAHAMLAHASPAVGSTVPQAPREVVLSFTEKLEPAFSTAEVHSGNGSVVSSGKARVDKSDATQMHVPLKPLAPGAYKVIWHVLSVDTHRTQGDFTFRVGP